MISLLRWRVLARNVPKSVHLKHGAVFASPRTVWKNTSCKVSVIAGVNVGQGVFLIPRQFSVATLVVRIGQGWFDCHLSKCSQ